LISRADFVFTIGYEGNVAVVDGALKKRYGSLSTEQLVERGLFKQALCSAIYEAQESGAGGSADGTPAGEAPAALQPVLDAYNQKTDRRVSTFEQLKRLFGVFEVPEGVTKVMVI
jgi:hypothetical protein